MTDEVNESPPPKEENDSAKFTVKRGHITSVIFYEINDYELGIFEQGGTASTALNFAIFLFSIAFSAATVLVTVDLSKNDRLYFSFFIIAVIGFVLGLFMLVNWWRGYQSVKSLCKKVRSRVESE
jgi:hypothetical protein